MMSEMSDEQARHYNMAVAMMQIDRDLRRRGLKQARPSGWRPKSRSKYSPHVGKKELERDEFKNNVHS